VNARDVLPTAAPEYVPDVHMTGEWHRRVVECLFHFGFDAAGMVHAPQLSQWGQEWCGVCETARPKGERCWFCDPPVLEEAV
jgi:hypothetical protein